MMPRATVLPFALLWALTTEPSCSRGVGTPNRIPRVDKVVAQVLSSGAGAVYLRIANESEAADVLESVEVPRAADAQLHEMIEDGELSTMRPAPNGFPIAPKGTLSLQRGGKHVMLFGVKDPEHVVRLELRLRFKRAGVIAVAAPVRRGIALSEVEQ